jgi:hypothetical protein
MLPMLDVDPSGGIVAKDMQLIRYHKDNLSPSCLPLRHRYAEDGPMSTHLFVSGPTRHDPSRRCYAATVIRLTLLFHGHFALNTRHLAQPGDCQLHRMRW